MWTQLAIILLVVSAAVSPGDTGTHRHAGAFDCMGVAQGSISCVFCHPFCVLTLIHRYFPIYVIQARSCGSNPVDVTSIKEGFCIFEFAGALIRCVCIFLDCPVSNPIDPAVLSSTEIASARGIDLMPNGDMLVLSRSNPAQIVALYEDSQGSSTTVVLASLAGLTHAVKYKDGYVYASSDTAVYRYAVQHIPALSPVQSPSVIPRTLSCPHFWHRKSFFI